ncbi:MAG: hypothetical protein R2797_06175 [Gelidibacter sp.]
MSFTIFALSIVLVLSLLFLMSPNVFEAEFWQTPRCILIGLASMIILILGCLPLLKMKIICIDSQRIMFKNYVFASRVKEVNLNAYDYYKSINEESENGIFEAVWLIKDEKLVDSFSTYQYSNYNALKSALNLRYKGKLDVSPMKQLFCRFGVKI